MTINEREINYLKSQLLYYKGKCEVYEAFLIKAGLINDPMKHINELNERLKND
jgi:hypothetical protein